ncbi:hypothetical protein MNBD_GAMMA04-1997 [hydrothermal vent metagenome]|uniref:Uncharacterized protein n=1 Tax=hydrothermal vent metagenome TaxID=652676 RepID=A0A3B0WAV0_9ZZZZ
MKNQRSKHALLGLILTTSVTSSSAFAEKPFLERSDPLAKMDTFQLCLDYANLTQEQQRQQFKQELDLRSQLSVKDHQLIDQHQVENSMTRCGMYMALGKPISEQSRQIRPMTFKTVHVYPNHYYVSQSGIIVETLERKEGIMPPTLVHTPPKVQAPPVAPK